MTLDNDDNKIDDANDTDGESKEEMDEELEAGSNAIEGDAEDKPVTRKWIGILIKVSLVVAVFFVVFYLIYFSTRYGKAKFVLSDNEIAAVVSDTAQQQAFKTNSRLYFYIEKENKNLESNLFVLQIEFFEDNSYRHYKQISYEVEKNFPKLSAYIPEEYFKREGKYRIKASLDSKIVDIREIQLVK